MVKKKVNKKCTCPKECDCQRPPPDNYASGGGDGVYGTSLSCSIHYINPKPDDDCPVHIPIWDGKRPIAIWEPKGTYPGW